MEGAQLTSTSAQSTGSRTGRGLRLAVLASGRGSNLAALLDAIADDPAFPGEVVAVVSDRPDAAALEHASARGVPAVVVDPDEHSGRATWEAALVDELTTRRVDAVVLAGFMRILSEEFVDRWPDRILNTHPSLLPAFPGAHAVRDALAHGVKVTGATVHLVDHGVDTGPIVAQSAVEVRDDDDEATLHARIQSVEHEMLPACVRLLCQGRLTREGRHVRIRPRDEEPS